MATGPGGGFSISNFLDQYEPSGLTGTASTSKSSTNGRGSDDRKITHSSGNGSSSGVRRERPAPIGVPAWGTDTKSNTASPLSTFTPPISKALDATQTTGDAAERKRKLEENKADEPKKKSRFDGMTREQKVAEVKRLKALKASKEAAKQSSAPVKDGNGSGSAASNPNSPTTAEASRKPVKGSYAEIMERAKQIQATAIQPPKIVHKEHKVEKKKIAKSDKPELAKKSAAAGSLKAKGTKMGTSSGISKQPPPKSSSRLPPKKAEPSKPIESRPKAQSSVEWSGTARPSASAKPPASKSSSRPAEPSRETGRSRDHSWERERERSRYRSPVKKYRYAESDEDDYYSDSDDMEATGVDILEEEELSREVGFREDIAAEREERELAARKRRLMGRRG